MFRRQLPNAITLFRLLAAGAFFAIVSVALRDPAAADRALWGTVAAGIFGIAAVSDVVDGWLARRWGVVSVFGRIMDPFCDKVLILGAFILLATPAFTEWTLIDVSSAPRPGDVIATHSSNVALTSTSGITGWMVVVILSRELLVTSLRGVLESMGHDFSADWAGKWKMLLQSFCIPLCLVVAVNEWLLREPAAVWVRDGFVLLTMLVTILSVVPYLLRARRLLARTPAAPPTRDTSDSGSARG